MATVANFTYKLVEKKDKNYISVMFWYSRGLEKRNSPCNGAQIKILTDLLKKMRNDDYRRFADSGAHSGTIVSDYITRVNHRIDHQTRVNPDNPMLNIAYQIGNNSHAGVQIFVKPLTAPSEVESGIAKIYDGSFGFNDMQVKNR